VKTCWNLLWCVALMKNCSSQGFPWWPSWRTVWPTLFQYWPPDCYVTAQAPSGSHMWSFWTVQNFCYRYFVQGLTHPPFLLHISLGIISSMGIIYRQDQNHVSPTSAKFSPFVPTHFSILPQHGWWLMDANQSTWLSCFSIVHFWSLNARWKYP